MAPQRSLDLAKLDPVASQLHLVIDPAQELQLAVRPPARQISGPVQPPAIAKRIRHEPLRRQPGPAKITPRQSRSADVKLPAHPDRHRLKRIVQHIDLRVRRSAGRSDTVRAALDLQPSGRTSRNRVSVMPYI